MYIMVNYEMKKQINWNREEVILLVNEYFRTKDLSKYEINNSIEFLSKLLRRKAILDGITIDNKFRNVIGITMKFANIKYLDKDRSIMKNSGLSNVSKLEKIIVDEYYKNKEEFHKKAYEILIKYTKNILDEI